MKKEKEQEKSPKKVSGLFQKKKEQKKPTVPVADVQRFNALASEGLSRAQVQERVEQG